MSSNPNQRRNAAPNESVPSPLQQATTLWDANTRLLLGIATPSETGNLPSPNSALTSNPPSRFGPVTLPTGPKNVPQNAVGYFEPAEDPAMIAVASMLPHPLSQFLADKEEALAFIDRYVRRSSAVRRAQVTAFPPDVQLSYVQKPLWAFVLYYMAYREQALAFSRMMMRTAEQSMMRTVCRVSWKMEKEEVRDMFQRWANMDAEGHRAAFAPPRPVPVPSSVVTAAPALPGANSN